MATSSIKSELSGVFIRKSYSASYSNLAAGATLALTLEDFGITDVPGYTYFALYAAYTGDQDVLYASSTPQGPNVLRIKNTGSAKASRVATIHCVYIRNDVDVPVITDN